MYFKDSILPSNGIEICFEIGNMFTEILHCYKFNGRLKTGIKHRHGFYEFIAIKSGRYKAFVNGTDYILKENAILGIAPFEMHTMETEDIGCHYCISFKLSSPNVDTKLRQVDAIKEIRKIIDYTNNSFVNEEKDIALFISIFELLIHELESKKVGYYKYAQVLVIELIIEIVRMISTEDKVLYEVPRLGYKKNYNMVVDVFIEDNISKHIKEEDVAAAVHVSVRQLNRIIKSNYDMTTHDYIVYKKLLAAKELLEQMEILDIDKALDYISINSKTYFIKLFKKRFKAMPPDGKRESECFRKLTPSK